MKEKKYKFSVVIPLYNVKKYLEDALKSVINQTIGFEKNIQLILVNDGSTDKSERICLKYKKLYPENIKYIYQENRGVSEARNEGMKYIEGKYVNFMDSDDKWDLEAFEKVYNFFEENESEIDLVACRIKFFEARNDYHKLDYKFKEKKIVDIKKDYQYIQLSGASTFIKSDEIRRYKYDFRLKYSEDATLIGKILMNKSKYGILPEAVYNYRKRKENTSALQNKEGKRTWYFDTIEYGYKTLMQESIKKYGIILPYYQFQIMYEIQWRINIDISLYLNDVDRKRYIKEICSLLEKIDDYIIMEQKYISKEYKILALCLKYHRDVRKEFYYNNSKIYFKEMKMFKIKNKSLFKITKLNITKQNICIEGIINCFLPQEDYKIFVKNIKEERYYIKEYDIIPNRQSIVGNLNNCKKFKLEIPINKDNMKLKIIMDYRSNLTKLNIILAGKLKLNNKNEILLVRRKKKIKIQDTKINIKELNNYKIIKEIYARLKEIVKMRRQSFE